MALFTGKGDDGTTTAFDCDQRFSKSSTIAEALGSLDELNSYLGVVKLSAKSAGHKISDQLFSDILSEIQQNLFTL